MGSDVAMGFIAIMLFWIGLSLSLIRQEMKYARIISRGFSRDSTHNEYLEAHEELS